MCGASEAAPNQVSIRHIRFGADTGPIAESVL